jgi:hypothetical protein
MVSFILGAIILVVAYNVGVILLNLFFGLFIVGASKALEYKQSKQDNKSL